MVHPSFTSLAFCVTLIWNVHNMMDVQYQFTLSQLVRICSWKWSIILHHNFEIKWLHKITFWSWNNLKCVRFLKNLIQWEIYRFYSSQSFPQISMANITENSDLVSVSRQHLLSISLECLQFILDSHQVLATHKN